VRGPQPKGEKGHSITVLNYAKRNGGEKRRPSPSEKIQNERGGGDLHQRAGRKKKKTCNETEAKSS